uniref:Seminal fluid protein CSSFP027 n=1 Tax=Chilo suppressalis TaxID=168631 RepID=G9F9H9_CHISP|nr:seminal fluid protein CSSFP027 [Chilo suppressalis]
MAALIIEGDSCEIEYTGILGTCTTLENCESARVNYHNNRITPTFCRYSAFGSSLVCCKGGQKAVVQVPKPRPPEPEPSPNPLRTLVLNRRGNARKTDVEGDSCVEEYTGSLGTCTPLDSCQSAKLIYEKAGLKPTFCRYNAFGESLVCCKDGKTILQTSKPRSADPSPLWTYENDKRRVSERKCDAYSRSVVQKVDVSALLVNDEGVSVVASKCQYTGVELIIGGEDANRGEFPYMAAIGWANSEGGYDFKCGGSLISSKYVLTAGHCTNDPRAYTPEPVAARLGEQNLDANVNDGADPVDVPIRHIISHPKYKPPSKYHDIALLELASDVQFEDAIRPACLWTRPDFGENNKAVATGWGVVDTLTKETSKDLQKVSLSLLDNTFCDPLLEWSWNRNWKGFVPEQMCAGELRGGRDTCQGDSGSPLQVTSPENHCLFYVMGVTSFGKKCGDSSQPAIYTRLSSYIDWIESVVWPGE